MPKVQGDPRVPSNLHTKFRFNRWTGSAGPSPDYSIMTLTQTDRQTYTGRQTGRHTLEDRQADSHTVRQTDKQTDTLLIK